MWRGVSLRKLAYLLLGPMLVETLSMLVVFYMALGAVRMGVPPRQQMLIGALGSAAYAVSAYTCGRWVTAKTAPNVMLLSIVVAALAGLSAMWVNAFWYFLLIVPVVGLCTAHFYVPFQVNMGHVRPFHTMAWTVAIYNVAWGIGGAAGPFLSGILRQSPTIVLGSLAIGLMLGHTALNLLSRTAPPADHAIEPTAAFQSTRLQRRVSWVAMIMSCLVYRGLYATLWPALGDARHWSDATIATGALMLALPLPLGALLWAKLRRKLVTPWIMIATMTIGAIGVLLIPLTDSPVMAIACIACCGLSESCVVFCMLYYANADEHTAGRSIGISEFLAGGGFVTGPMMMGLLAWDDATSMRPYLAGGLGMAATIAIVIWMWLRGRRDGAVSPAT